MGLNPVRISKMESDIAQQQSRYDEVITVREYDRGDTPDLLSDYQKIQMVGADSAGNPNSDPEVRLNVCCTANQVETNRLDIQDITVTVEGNEASTRQGREALKRISRGRG